MFLSRPFVPRLEVPSMDTPDKDFPEVLVTIVAAMNPQTSDSRGHRASQRQGPAQIWAAPPAIDPTTWERDYNNEEIEFMRQMDQYKRENRRPFPTWSEVLEVLRPWAIASASPRQCRTVHHAAAPRRRKTLDRPCVVFRNASSYSRIPGYPAASGPSARPAKPASGQRSSGRTPMRFFYAPASERRPSRGHLVRHLRQIDPTMECDGLVGQDEAAGCNSSYPLCQSR